MRKPTKYERETLIHWNEGNEDASIFTYNSSLKRRLGEFADKYPKLCVLESSSGNGCVTYRISKQRLSIRLVPPVGDERRAEISKTAKIHGFGAVLNGVSDTGTRSKAS